MLKKRVTFCILPFCAIATSALAQPLPQRCDSKQKEIDTMSQSVASLNKEVADVNAQLEVLKKQVADLEQTAAAKSQQKTALENQLAAEKSAKETMCKPLAICAGYETKLAELKSAFAPIFDALRAERQEAQTHKGNTLRMKDRITSIKAEYPTLPCNKLVDGETPKATIDRCNVLFKEWQSIESDVSKVNDQIRAVRDQYKSQKKNAAPHGKVLIKLYGDMHKTCDFSLQLGETDKLYADNKDIVAAETDLNDTDSNVKAIKAVVIKEPKITKKPQPQTPTQQAQTPAQQTTPASPAKTSEKESQTAAAKPTDKSKEKEENAKGKGGLDIDIKGKIKGDVDVSKKGVSGKVEAEGEVDVNKKKVAGGKIKTDTSKLPKVPK